MGFMGYDIFDEPVRFATAGEIWDDNKCGACHEFMCDEDTKAFDARARHVLAPDLGDFGFSGEWIVIDVEMTI